MRAVSLLLLVPMVVVFVGCASTGRRRSIPAEYKTVERCDVSPVYAAELGATCKPPGDLGCCRGSATGTPKPVTYVVSMSHSAAIAALRENGFTNVCCDGDDAHHNHSTSAIVLWQKCSAPDTLNVDNVVYLCFDPKHNGHP